MSKNQIDEHDDQTEEHTEDIRMVAKNYIQEFFLNKSWHCGGKIPQRDLLSEASIDTVILSKFCKQWEDFVHIKCLTKIPTDPNYKDETLLPWAVRYLIDLLSSMGACSIPKEFRPGMVVLYFRFCKGISVSYDGS